MEIIKSIRGGSKLCNNGYCNTKKKTTKTMVRWECSKKCSVQCHGSVTTDSELIYYNKSKIFYILIAIVLI